MNDKKAERQARKEAIWSHMDALRTISNKRPWYNCVNKGSLTSRKGVYMNLWQWSVLLVVMLGGLVWAFGVGIRGIERVGNSLGERIELLEYDIDELEKKNEALTKELDECKGTKTETSDDKTMTP